MKQVFTSLYGKISLIFLLLLLLIGFLQVILSIYFFTTFYEESDQKLNRTLAQDLAQKFKPFLEDSLDYAGIEHSFHEMMVMNPRVEFYLLDETGKILAYFAEPEKIKRTFVDIDPINQFLLTTANVTMPFYGDDPRHAERKKPFSVSPIKIGPKQNGFLYVILGGEQYDSALTMIRDSYIVRSSAMILLLIVFITGVIGLILFFLLTKRMRTLVSAVQRYEDGNFEKSIEIRSKDEIGQLSQAFNQMADTIKKNLQEIKKNDDLRRELIANVSHDLRSPLASIQGYLETILIKEKTLSIDERHRFLETILNNTKKLNKLVYELFELSKLDAKQIKPKPESFSLSELAQDVILKFEPYAKEKHIKILSCLPEKLPFVFCDLGMIERALTNLIENALINTPENGTIKVELVDKQSTVQVDVIDTGSGISADDLPYIFDRFYRGDKSRSSEGTGLGLAITKKIIQTHQSEIFVQSEIGKGTKFEFNLPKI